MFDRSRAAQLLTTAGATGAAMDHVSQGRSVTRGLASAITIKHQHPPVPRCRAQNKSARLAFVVGVNRSHQRTLAFAGKLDGLTQVGIGHDRRYRAKGFNAVNFFGGHGAVTTQQRSGIKSTCIAI